MVHVHLFSLSRLLCGNFHENWKCSLEVVLHLSRSFGHPFFFFFKKKKKTKKHPAPATLNF